MLLVNSFTSYSAFDLSNLRAFFWIFPSLNWPTAATAVPARANSIIGEYGRHDHTREIHTTFASLTINATTGNGYSASTTYFVFNGSNQLVIRQVNTFQNGAVLGLARPELLIPCASRSIQTMTAIENYMVQNLPTSTIRALFSNSNSFRILELHHAPPPLWIAKKMQLMMDL